MVRLPEGKGYIFLSRSCRLAQGTQPSSCSVLWRSCLPVG